MDADVLIIGAGLTGLACALALHQAGLEARVLEAADRPGGRLATDAMEGFLLDRGFQVLQTWYPAAREHLDYAALDLRPFFPGALVRWAGRFWPVSDIWRHPLRLPEMLVSPIGSLADKLRLLRLRRRALAGDLDSLYVRPETTALELLRGQGFSTAVIERFFRPFFAGVFFEPDLSVSSRTFEFVFRAFALGDTALPAQGMGAIPAQLAARLPPGWLRTGVRVTSLGERGLTTADGQRLSARAVVIATDGANAARLLGRPPPRQRGTTCWYFAAPAAPIAGPWLAVDGQGQGPVYSLLCPSNLSAAYAPAGQALITANCFGADADPADLEPQVRRQLTDWFGPGVADWRRLAVYRLPAALPAQQPPVSVPAAPTQVRDGLWLAGEAVAPPSIHWALQSGRRTGEAIAAAL